MWKKLRKGLRGWARRMWCLEASGGERSEQKGVRGNWESLRTLCDPSTLPVPPYLTASQSRSLHHLHPGPRSSGLLGAEAKAPA